MAFPEGVGWGGKNGKYYFWLLEMDARMNRQRQPKFS